jgi:hypothetical protein
LAGFPKLLVLVLQLVNLISDCIDLGIKGLCLKESIIASWLTFLTSVLIDRFIFHLFNGCPAKNSCINGINLPSCIVKIVSKAMTSSVDLDFGPNNQGGIARMAMLHIIGLKLVSWMQFRIIIRLPKVTIIDGHIRIEIKGLESGPIEV